DDPLFSHLPRFALTRRISQFYSPELRNTINGYQPLVEMRSQLPDEFATWHPLSRAQYLETRCLLPGYILSSQGDRVAMAHGVEARFPFLDPEVVAFGSRLPATLKLRRLDEKYLLKQFARTIVPTPVWRRAKQPYRAPGIAPFFADGSRDYVDDLLSHGQLQRDGIFSADAVALLVKKCREGRATSEKDTMAFVGVLSTQIL